MPTIYNITCNRNKKFILDRVYQLINYEVFVKKYKWVFFVKCSLSITLHLKCNTFGGLLHK